MSTPYSSLHLFEQLITENPSAEVIELLQREIYKAIETVKPYQRGMVYQSICRLVLSSKQCLLKDTTLGPSFEEQTLTWVCKQVNDEVQIPLSVGYWKKLKSLDSWLEIFFQGAMLAPKNASLEVLIPLAIDDFKSDFALSFQLLKLCWNGQRHLDFNTALENCKLAPVQFADDRLELLTFLRDKTYNEQSFIQIAQAAILSESLNIGLHQRLLLHLQQMEYWELVIACSHKIISIAEAEVNDQLILETASQLILAEIRCTNYIQAAQLYQKYWYSSSINEVEFPYAGELIFALHATKPHDEIIQHICSNINRQKHTENLNQKQDWALLIEAKRLEFAGHWNQAMDLWDTLYLMYEEDNEAWKVALCCFIANNGILSKQEDLIREALKILQKSPLREMKIYRRIILTLKVYLGGYDSRQILEALRLEYGNSEDLDQANLLPAENEAFSTYLIPRVLEALLSENHGNLFYKSLNNSVTRRKMPKYDRLFILRLTKINMFWLRRKQLEKDEVVDFVYICHSALKLPLTNRQLLLLTERVVPIVEELIPKDKFGDYQNSDVTHFMNVLLWLVAFRCERLNDAFKGNEMEKQQRDIEIKNMKCHNMASVFRLYAQQLT